MAGEFARLYLPLRRLRFKLSIDCRLSPAAIGFVFCVIRILFCVCPSHCIRRDRKKTSKVDADHRTSLLKDTKRVSIAKGPYINVSFIIQLF